VDQARATVGLASELAVATTAVPAETADFVAMARALAPVDVGVDLLRTVATPIQCTHEDITDDRVVMQPLLPTELVCKCSSTEPFYRACMQWGMYRLATLVKRFGTTYKNTQKREAGIWCVLIQKKGEAGGLLNI
jgi:hypothetical protein